MIMKIQTSMQPTNILSNNNNDNDHNNNNTNHNISKHDTITYQPANNDDNNRQQ